MDNVKQYLKSYEWSKADHFDFDLGISHKYIINGAYGVIGTIGRDDWNVVHAEDSLPVDEGDPLCTDLSEQDAMRKAEMLQEDDEAEAEGQ